MDRDAERLHLLAIFHWVVAGMTALFSLFPVIHLLMGITLVSGQLHAPKANGLDQMFGWFFILFACGFIFLGLSLAAGLAIAGRCIARREYRTFCLVIAGVACMFFPFGTALGVFTIVVLSRDSVRALFEKPRPHAIPVTG
jgi:hypothetical protein